MHWRRKWQPTPVFLPGESQEWGSLVGCHLWGYTESDTTETTKNTHILGGGNPSFEGSVMYLFYKGINGWEETQRDHQC